MGVVGIVSTTTGCDKCPYVDLEESTLTPKCTQSASYFTQWKVVPHRLTGKKGATSSSRWPHKLTKGHPDWCPLVWVDILG